MELDLDLRYFEKGGYVDLFIFFFYLIPLDLSSVTGFGFDLDLRGISTPLIPSI